VSVVLARIRLIGALAAVLLPLAASAPAHAADKRFYIRGAGYGHGVGMSQYGAYGYALNGRDAATILAHYYTGTKLDTTASGQVVRVILRSVSGGSMSFTGGRRAGTRKISPEKTYSVARGASGQVVLRSPGGRTLQAFDPPMRVLAVSGTPLTLNGGAGNGVKNGQYRGSLEFRPGALGGLYAVNAVRLEDYLRGVVPAESPAVWPAAALQAQAIAARTYAITTNVGGNGFTQYPDTRSQMYRGVVAEKPTSDDAIQATRGKVVTYNGRPVVTYFFSTSGGKTENVENAFRGAKPQPWLKSVDDPYDDVSPKHRWGPIKLTMGGVAKKLKGLVKGSFKGIDVTRRGRSPRIVDAQVVGSGGRTSVTGSELRARLGLFDTWAYFTEISSGKEPAPLPPSPSGDSDTQADPSGGTRAPKSARTAALASIAGAITPGRAGAKLTVERREGTVWLLDHVTTVRRHGRYRASVTRPGVYRVVYAHMAGPSVRIR
jgi:stage II sporulation protein D